MSLMHSKPKASLWMVAWAVSFSCAMMLNKGLNPCIPVVTVIWMRCFFALLFLGPVLWHQRRSAFQSRSIFLQLLRGCCISGSLMLTYLAYRHLPTHTAGVLGTSGPLLTILFSGLFLKERFSFKQKLFLFSGYLGVLFVVQPHTITVNAYVFLSLGANVLLALSTVLARVLSLRQESTLTTLFFSNVTPMLLYSLLMVSFVQPLALSEIGFLALLGLCGAFSQFCLLQGVHLAKASFLAPFEYLRLCFLIPLAYVFFGEIPTMTIVLGGLLIIVSNLFLAFWG